MDFPYSENAARVMAVSPGTTPVDFSIRFLAPAITFEMIGLAIRSMESLLRFLGGITLLCDKSDKTKTKCKSFLGKNQLPPAFIVV